MKPGCLKVSNCPRSKFLAEFAPFAEKWWAELKSELEPLAGKKIDPRFVQVIMVKL